MTASLLSVGIDIGTATTQVVFTRLALANMASYFSSPRVEITDKRVVYRGGVHTTPLLSRVRLDGGAIRRIVEAEYGKAGVTPGDVDTGAVIITGEAARKENADNVLEKLSCLAGNFVVATAGPDLEGILAGKGSGAQRHSAENDCVVANLDIGGGTTNIAVFEAGEVAAVGCLDIGGRLVRLSERGLVEYVSPAAKLVADGIGVEVGEGMKGDARALRRMTDAMNGALEAALGLARGNGLAERLITPGSSRLSLDRRIDAIAFSGGVADCVRRPDSEDFRYRDIGVLLGRSIAAGRLVSSVRNLVSDETIRATVIGAGSFTTTLSGSTIACAEGVVPQKNLPALKLAEAEEEALFAGDGAPLQNRLRWFLEQRGAEQLVLGMRGGGRGYAALTSAAGAAVRALDRALPPGAALFVAVEQDIAKAFGQCMEKAPNGGRRVVCIDGIRLAEGDFLDIGAPVMGGLAVPVVVKTLVFG